MRTSPHYNGAASTNRFTGGFGMAACAVAVAVENINGPRGARADVVGSSRQRLFCVEGLWLRCSGAETPCSRPLCDPFNYESIVRVRD